MEDSIEAFFYSPFPFSEGSSSRAIHILESWHGSVPTFDSEFHVRSIHVDSEPIVEGDDKWAQVWKGKLHYDSGQSDKEPVDVAIKIFQESLFPAEEFEEENDRTTGAKLASIEARAYTAMKDLQGKVIPKSFGFYKVFAYYDRRYEACYAHIMQLIPLPNLWSLPDPVSDDTVSSLLDLLIPSLNQIHKCGIAHHDLSPSNVLIDTNANSNSDATSEPIVSKVYLIDFAMSKIADAESIKYDGDSVIGTLRLLRVDDARGFLLRWYRRHLQDSYATETFANVELWERPKDGRRGGEYPEAVRRFIEITTPKPGSIWYGITL